MTYKGWYVIKPNQLVFILSFFPTLSFSPWLSPYHSLFVPPLLSYLPIPFLFSLSLNCSYHSLSYASSWFFDFLIYFPIPFPFLLYTCLYHFFSNILLSTLICSKINGFVLFIQRVEYYEAKVRRQLLLFLLCLFYGHIDIILDFSHVMAGSVVLIYR